ncbi:MAG: DUF481 domain-containing protein [Polyangia bacterium]|nr:DUF481 domain-containing protein [Polyangia bacterium]
MIGRHSLRAALAPLARPVLQHGIPPWLFGWFFLLLALTSHSAPGWAQVNTERLRSKKTETGLHGHFEGALTMQTGNTDLVLATLGARLEYLRGVHGPFLQGSYSVGEKDGSKFIHNGFIHGRWTAMWHHRVGTEVFTQVQFDDLLRMHLRYLLGAGLRLKIVRNARLWIYLGSGYMMEYEDLNIDEGDPHPKTTLNHRWTSYLLLRVFFTSWLRLVATTYAQPRFDDFGDFRFLEDLSVVFRIKKWLSLDFNFVVMYDSRPPSTVHFTDTRTLVKLRVSW